MESPATTANYALEDGVAPPATRANRKKRIVLIVVALAVVVAAAVAIGVTVANTKSSNKTAASSDASTSEGYVCDEVKQDYGYIRLPNKVDGHYFYWYFESRVAPATAPLVLWLTGGPGCSSLWAMLAENGPCTVQKDLTTQKNPYSWNTNANVIWLDQPTFTGYSYGRDPIDFDDDAKNVRQNLYYFFQGFFAKHPELRTRDLYITGESYAGHYIPPSAQYIWKQNTYLTAANETNRINLKGIAIGNGITATSIQYAHYLDMANNSYGIQLSSSPELVARARANITECVDSIRECQAGGASECVHALNTCYDDMESAFDITNRNPYDIRQICTEADAVDCYNSTHITQYLNSDKIQTYLEIPKDKVPTWVECNSNVSANFMLSGDYLADHQSYVADLLNGSDIRVLIYAGDADTVCNWIGNYEWTKQLDWTHKKEFNAASERDFVTKGGAKAGIVRSYGTQFTFLRVFQSGHMVPMDQPAVALEMLQRFMTNTTI